MPKDTIIAALGERELQLPALLERALTANDRAKYLLTLLQSARSAGDGMRFGDDLHEERIASGIADAAFDQVIAGSAVQRDGRYRIPGGEQLLRRALDEVGEMLVPLELAEVPAAAGLRERVDTIAAALHAEGDLVSREDVGWLTALPGGDTDSLHLVVMDAHRELNALQTRIATESVDGAHARDLKPGDRALVRAFMHGLHRTERLRFDHPGLSTVATHTGPALLLQNDIGETDAHVVVIRINGLVLTITYTDVHLRRLVFFQELLSAWPLAWEDTRSRADKRIEGGMYHLASGRFEAGDADELARFLEHFGSRLVFMIDWNRARKRLRRLVGRAATLRLLRYAAEHEYGHMAFLRAGGDALVYEALEFAARGYARPGESLEDVLGVDEAFAYLRAVLRICSEGLQAGEALTLVQDEVRAELTGYLRSAREQILLLARRHAELSVEIAEVARDGVELAIVGAQARLQESAARAQRWEHEADKIVSEARAAALRSPDMQPFVELLRAADDIADCAEEAAFYASLLPAGHPRDPVRVQVRRIAELVLTAARDYLRAVELSVDLRRGGARADTDAFLEAAHGAIALEHEADTAQREVHRALVADGQEPDRVRFVIVELTRAFEEASDALMHTTYLLRAHALERVIGSESVRVRTALTPRAGEPTEPTEPTAGGRVDGQHLYMLGDAGRPLPDADAIGAKAHGLARGARAGLRVPEAAVLSTGLARAFSEGTLSPDELDEVLAGAVAALQAQTGLHFGAARNPLLLAVRAGAPVSMPGTLATVLDVGMSEAAVRGLIAATGNPRLAWDCFRRFVESYATVVRGCPRAPFAEALQAHLHAAGAQRPRELSARVLEQLAHAHVERFEQLTQEPFPTDPMQQLRASVRAALASWDTPRARDYRRLHAIADGSGTAVLLQRMVFGNAGGASGAGVAFTRDPGTGERGLYMDFTFDAQGDDAAAGRGADELALMAPALLAEIERVCGRLEGEFGDAQELELTVQEGQLYVLQTRTAKRTPWAALHIAIDQVQEGLVSAPDALARLADLDLDALQRVHVTVSHGADVICHATPAGFGVAAGPLALDGEAAERFARAGTPAVLIRPDALADDLRGLDVAAGLLTAAGTRTAPAATVARELDLPCLVGCDELELDLGARVARIDGRTLAEGDVICLDAEAGVVFAGAPAVLEVRPTRELEIVARWPVAAPPAPADAVSTAAGPLAGGPAAPPAPASPQP